MTYSYDIRLYHKISGYNPPNVYKHLHSSAAVKAFLESDNVFESDCLHSCDNNRGRVVVQDADYVYSATVVAVREHVSDSDETVRYIIGTVDTVSRVSATEIELTYTIDHYTSAVVSYFEQPQKQTVRMHLPMPTADTLLCKRASDGERTYLADNFTQNSSHLTDVDFKFGVTQTACTTSVFTTGRSLTQFMVYHETVTNTTHWICMSLTSDYFWNPYSMWSNYLNACMVSNDKEAGGQYDPKGVLFFGWVNIDIGLIQYVESLDYAGIKVLVLNYVHREKYKEYEGLQFYKFTASYERYIDSEPMYYMIGKGNINPTEYSRYVMYDSDCSVLYEFPVGVHTGVYLATRPVLNTDTTSPSFTFRVPESNAVQTFTVTVKPLTFLIDSEQVYKVEERVYQMEMRNQQSIDNLVSGITGALTTGATVYGFSRGLGEDTEGGHKPRSTLNQGNAGFKGLLGGGVAMAGAIGSFAYDELYANEKYQQIEDNHMRVQPDSVLMSSMINASMCLFAGVKNLSYDDTTKDNIYNYQSRFGYQTNRVDSNLALNVYTGYIQGELIMQPGFNKTVENYICKMFRNGVYFND